LTKTIKPPTIKRGGVKMKILIVILLVILLLTCGFVAGVNYRTQELDTTPLNIEFAIEIIERARYSHQYYIDNPDELGNATVQNMRHHRDCVIRYTYVINLLKEKR